MIKPTLESVFSNLTENECRAWTNFAKCSQKVNAIKELR